MFVSAVNNSALDRLVDPPNCTEIKLGVKILWDLKVLCTIIIIIMKISRAPVYHTRWQHRALYNNTNHTHTHTHTQRRMGRAVNNSLEIIIKQVRLEGGFEGGGRIRVAGCLRQIVPDRWASIRKRSFTKCFSRQMDNAETEVTDANE